MLSKRFLHLIAFASVLVLLSAWMPSTAAADTRCATVNADELLKNYKKANDQRKALLAKRDQHKQRLATLVSRRTKVSESMASLRERSSNKLKLQKPEKHTVIGLTNSSINTNL